MPVTILYPGCTSDSLDIPVKPDTNADGKYNIVFITTDQEIYMENFPVGSDYAARERLRTSRKQVIDHQDIVARLRDIRAELQEMIDQLNEVNPAVQD